MFSALHYLALAIALLPFSGFLAAVCCHAWDEHRDWNSSGGNAQKPEGWHRKGRTAATQHRTRR